MADPFLGGLRGSRPSDYQTHSLEASLDDPTCIACMALFLSDAAWPIVDSARNDCTMDISAPGGAEVCRNCLSLDIGVDGLGRGSSEQPISCVPVPHEYAELAYKLRRVARSHELCDRWALTKVVVVEYDDRRTTVYGNIHNQIDGKGIREFARSKRRLRGVRSVEILTRDQVEEQYLLTHALSLHVRGNAPPITDAVIPTIATDSATNLGRDLATFTSTFQGRDRVIQCLLPVNFNMPAEARFDADSHLTEDHSDEGREEEQMDTSGVDEGSGESSEAEDDSSEGSEWKEGSDTGGEDEDEDQMDLDDGDEYTSRAIASDDSDENSGSAEE